MDAVGVDTSGEPRPQQPQVLELCRICLLGSTAMRGLFPEDDGPSLAHKAMSFASVKILPGDGLPSHICCDCSDKLDSAYKFKLQVEQADNVLRERLDSLNIKEELFFSDVDVNLSAHRNDVGEITAESLILKDHHMHMDLLNVQKKIYNGQDILHHQRDDLETQNDNIGIHQHEEVQKTEDEEQLQINNEKDVIVNNNQEIEMQQMSSEQANQAFEAQEIQEMMLNDINDQERMQKDMNHAQQLAMHEHNYVAESSDFANVNDVQNSEQLEHETKEDIEKESLNEETYDASVESTGNESIRRSKRRISQRKSQVNCDSDEENYFENLNLSSRLKKVQSQKVYFMCYLCEKQFVSKEMLKEHMHTHEEVRKTLSLTNKKPAEKLPKSPEKPQDTSVNLSPAKSPSSGKKPNTCPHCGKEYLYIISFNKHLKQHEKAQAKDESMPLEVSFEEDDDALDFHDYDENPTVGSDSEEDEIKEENQVQIKQEFTKQNSIKCNVCEEEFDSADKLKNHRAKHVMEGVLSEQNDEQLDSGLINENENKDEINFEESTFLKKEDVKEFKCPHCPVVYSHKKSLARHLETHSSVKYTCKLCTQSFSRKDHLRHHIERHHVRQKSFKCTQCNKSFGNELTLRNHLIATNHKTIVQGQEYDPNKRIKRVAAKAAQKIIDKIKTDLNMDEEEEEEEETEREKDRDFMFAKEEFEIPDGVKTSKKLPRNKTLTCATCNHKCPTKQALTKHMEQHVKDENVVKQEKNVTQKSEETQEKEENEIDHEEDDDDFEGGLDWPMDSHECPTCKKQYSTKKSLLRHQLLHEEPNFECDICNVKFYRKDKLKAHYDKCSEKNPDQVRKCNICGDIFENNEILKEHRAKHVMEGILTEEDLREIEPRPEDRNGEKAPRKRRTDIVGLECTECNKRYTSRKGLLRHIQVHEGKKYLCDICPKKFYRREHLKIHVAKHNMIKPYKCPRCSKRFIKEEQLNNHISKHDKTFKKAKESDTSKRFLCEICSKSFTQSTTLIAHLRAHNGIKPYVCEVCSRPFTTNAYLKMHMRTHTQERPYICQYCSRAFARADTLANHLTSHTGEAKYHCKYCPKNFRRLKSLKEHVFIHTGQRPYSCPTCDRRFNNNGSRYAHSKRCKQNLLQNRTNQITVQPLTVEQEPLTVEQEQEEQEHLQLQEQQHQQLQEQHLQLQTQRIHQATISQAQVIKPQNVKTITITRQDGGLTQQHVMTHQEILMPLILPLTVTLTDVGDETILPEGTKIFTT